MKATSAILRWGAVGISILVLATCIGLAIVVFSQRLRLSFAAEQISVFHSMEDEAERGDVTKAIECLEYTLWYYPSGTKQAKDGQLDRIVEECRARAVLRIVDVLERKSGENHGADPEKWRRAMAG